jgi:hypothetical protein
MSTKATIAHGKAFHFYHECFDDDHVYLEIEGTEFEAGYNRVMVPIPIHIWEIIRERGGADISLAPLTDAELNACVEKEVDHRIAEYERITKEGGQTWFLFGVDRPRDEQIAETRDRLYQERQHQREIAVAIARWLHCRDPRAAYRRAAAVDRIRRQAGPVTRRH